MDQPATCHVVRDGVTYLINRADLPEGEVAIEDEAPAAPEVIAPADTPEAEAEAADSAPVADDDGA